MFKVSATVGNMLAHRLSYADVNGPIPKGSLVLHSCDNPACVNPHHLRIGSHKDNVADMDARNRRVPPSFRGETVPTSKLKEHQVRALRDDYLHGDPLNDICSRYGISRSSLGDFIGGRSWRHILTPDEITALKEEAARRRRNNAKINAHVAREIRERLSRGELGKNLAVEYGVHKATISDIKLRKIWADLG